MELEEKWMRENKNLRKADSLSILIDLIPDPVSVVDSKSTIVAANNSAGEYADRTKDQLLSKDILELDFVTEEFKSLLLRNTEKRLAGSDIPPYEIKIYNKNGQIRYLEVKGNRIEYKGQTLDLAIFRDITEEKNIQKRLKDDLRESTEKFYAIVNSVKDPMILVDEETKITHWNPGAENTFGYSSSEAIGKNVHELVVPNTTCKEGLERIKTSIEIFSETGRGYFTIGNVQLVGRRKDGREFPAELSISPIKLGGKWNAVGVVKDITKRKYDEEMLREAEQRYHALFDHAPIGVLIVDPKTADLVEFNDFAHQQLGYSREEFRNLTIPDIEAKESKYEVMLRLAEMSKEGGGEFETLQRAKDGTIKNVLVNTRVIKFAGRTFLHCIFRDITEIRTVENSLLESETQYRQLVELAEEGVWAFDRNYVTRFVNPRMAEMLGYVQSEMVGKSAVEFVDISKVTSVKEFLGNYADGISGKFEYDLIRKDGSHVYASIAASQIYDDQGKNLGTLALLNDITQRKEMEDKLEKYSKHLEELVLEKTKQLAEAQAQIIKSERLAAIGELAGMIGHDLRNPLAGIKNSAYYLKKKGAEIPENQAKEMIETINKCVEHSNKIINDLLDYSREIRLDRKDIPVAELLSEALSMVRVPEKVKIANNLTDTDVNVDEDRIERVFINLMKNAVDAMPDGGTLSINSKPAVDRLEVSFADTGMGISDEILPKLFSPLFTTKAQGMGFGLAICKRIVEAHEGTITVHTCKGTGTTFTVTLPLVKREMEVKNFG
jgi:PAS domain S-box-containing protein